jgi:hypothetical protein
MNKFSEQCATVVLLAFLSLTGAVGAADAPAAAAPAAKPEPKLAAAETKVADRYRADAEKLKTINETKPPAVRATAEIVASKMKICAELHDKIAAAYTSGDLATVKSLSAEAAPIDNALALEATAPTNRASQLNYESEESFTNWQNQYPQAIDLLKIHIAARKNLAEKYRLLTDIQVAAEFDREAFYLASDAVRKAEGEHEVALVSWQRIGRIRQQTDAMKKAGLSPAKLEVMAEAERQCKEMLDALRVRNENTTTIQQLSRDTSRILNGDMPAKKK